VGLQLNVWGVGTIVTSFCTAGEAITPGRINLAVERDGEEEEEFYTHEPEIARLPYSGYLRYVLFRTLAYDPDFRFTTTELVKITREVLNYYDISEARGKAFLNEESPGSKILQFHLDGNYEDWEEENYFMSIPEPVSGDYESAISKVQGDFDVLGLPSASKSQALSRRASWETLEPVDGRKSPNPWSEYV